jgi:hypothetical protein
LLFYYIILAKADCGITETSRREMLSWAMPNTSDGVR